MRKLYALSIALACVYLLPLSLAAQDTCTAAFTITGSGNTVNFFSNSRLPTGTLHNWIFGDGSAGDSRTNPVHTYAAAGTYFVKHYVFNQSTNCNDSSIKEIHVPLTDCNIFPDFTFYRDSPNCRKIHFVNQSSSSTAAHFVWKFGDGTTSTDISPTHEYPVDSNYNVCLQMETANNCVKEICKLVEAHCAPPPCNISPVFTFYRDSSNCRKIHFVNQSISSSAANYLWKFGDGTTSTDINPTHEYPVDSNYNVCLQVQTSNNCVKELCKLVEVHCAPPCNLQVKFTWKTEVENPLKVFFYNQTIVATTNVKYEWKFGDGTASDQRDPVHVYEHGGEYEVCLTVKVSDNCKSTSCQKIMVHDCDVHARFESKRDASQWNKIWFNNVSQPVPNIWRTSWTYGDGTGSQDFNSFHVYQQQGKYSVCLKVQSLQGCIDTYCDSIIVRRPDTCVNHSDFRFEASTNNPLEIRFKPTQVNLTWKYYWEFGDGKSSTAVTPVHKYDHSGLYQVCLTVVTLNHCSTHTCKQVLVSAVVNCDTVRLKFTYTRTQEHPNQLHFFAVSNVAVLSQKWAILKLGGPILPPPVPVFIETNNLTYTFTDTGRYMVCLYARTFGDCNKVYCDTIHIDRLGNSAEVPGSPVNVVPNPATNTARVEFQMEQAGPVTLRILDAAGAAQFTLSAVGQAGNNRMSIPVNKLGNGFYMVEIRYGNRLKLAKFQKS